MVSSILCAALIVFYLSTQLLYDSEGSILLEENVDAHYRVTEALGRGVTWIDLMGTLKRKHVDGFAAYA